MIAIFVNGMAIYHVATESSNSMTIAIAKNTENKPQQMVHSTFKLTHIFF